MLGPLNIHQLRILYYPFQSATSKKESRHFGVVTRKTWWRLVLSYQGLIGRGQIKTWVYREYGGNWQLRFRCSKQAWTLALAWTRTQDDFRCGTDRDSVIHLKTRDKTGRDMDISWSNLYRAPYMIGLGEGPLDTLYMTWHVWGDIHTWHAAISAPEMQWTCVRWLYLNGIYERTRTHKAETTSIIGKVLLNRTSLVLMSSVRGNVLHIGLRSWMGTCIERCFKGPWWGQNY
jgi:hypothetical protein